MTLVGLSVLFALGVVRQAAALLLGYGWACLFNRNVLISNPSIAYVGLLLLLTMLVPAREPLRAFGDRSSSDEFYVPAAVGPDRLVVMAAGYTFSGRGEARPAPAGCDGTRRLAHGSESACARRRA